MYSIKKFAAQIDTTKWIVYDTLKQLPHLLHIQKLHAMIPDNYSARLNYVNWFLQKFRESPHFTETVLFMDQKGFTKDEIINSHN